MKSRKDGAQTTLYLALSTEVKGISGGYYSVWFFPYYFHIEIVWPQDCKRVNESSLANDNSAAKELFDYTLQTVRLTWDLNIRSAYRIKILCLICSCYSARKSARIYRFNSPWAQWVDVSARKRAREGGEGKEREQQNVERGKREIERESERAKGVYIAFLSLCALSALYFCALTPFVRYKTNFNKRQCHLSGGRRDWSVISQLFHFL